MSKLDFFSYSRALLFIILIISINVKGRTPSPSQSLQAWPLPLCYLVFILFIHPRRFAFFLRLLFHRYLHSKSKSSSFQIYGLSSLLVNLYSLGYMITNLVVGIPISYCLSYYSIRTNVLLMMLLGVTGSWVRCLVNSSFYFAFIGQYVLGASFSFYRGLVTRISSIWFPPEMRATSTAIMFTCLLTADTLSIFQPISCHCLIIHKLTILPCQAESLFTFLYWLVLLPLWVLWWSSLWEKSQAILSL